MLEHIEAKVIDQSGKIVNVNEPGELLVRGYNNMIGYWDDKAKTEETFTSDRFLKTGLVEMSAHMLEPNVTKNMIC